ncbi:hypothetical protein CBR_g471 [Chara braunii]|uniref:Exostosin GT47 domain-containing protein n=1 Tax=Chara braunii TaxID=69332 RepID=A0A388KBK3_CHABU|nr:hypothetical protein CBR_g471 [Chara braunii]|eukprot:GBG67333.1 hypothetical protein CBR_g471 [Chara braunii]
MTQSVFCLCPLGWTPWTLRFYQAIMARCIPVVIADNIEFPWENFLDYSQFSLKIPENQIDSIVSVMRGISAKERERKRQEMEKVWMMFTYQRPPQPGDAFFSVLRELTSKIRRFKTSSSHVWT